jgi:N-acetylmuramoyl-L-alanine amidase
MYIIRRYSIFILLVTSFFCVSCAKTSFTPREDQIEMVAVRPLLKPIAPIPVSFPNIPSSIPFSQNSSTISGPLVIIDAGHGGKDMGTQSTKGAKAYEKHLTLTTAEYLSRYLGLLGYRTAMTRTSDIFIDLKDRSAFANEKKPAAFVSIHYNSAPNKDAHGIEVYYFQSDDDKERTKKSKLLAKKVLDRALEYTKAKSRGAKHGNYAVIRETDMPAIIVEGGFMTNEEEMNKIRDLNYLRRLAWGIAEGVQQYLLTKKI